MDGTIGNEFILSGVIAWWTARIIEKAKQSNLVPWLTVNSERVNGWVAIVTAGIAAVGVHATFDQTAGVLTITGLTAAGLWNAAMEYARQYMLQQIAYKKLVKPDPAEKPIVVPVAVLPKEAA